MEYNFKIGWKILERFRSIDKENLSVNPIHIWSTVLPFSKEYRMIRAWRRKSFFEHSESSFYRWQQRHSIVDQNNTKREVFLSKRLGQYIFFFFNSDGPSSTQRSTGVNKEEVRLFSRIRIDFTRTQFFNSSRNTITIPKKIPIYSSATTDRCDHSLLDFRVKQLAQLRL